MNTSKASSERNRQPPESLQNRTMKAVSEYNRQLNQERKDDRRVCMDLQTYTIHYPTGLGKDHKGLRQWTKRMGGVHQRGRYPVALLPNQYQDWYTPYTSNELKYLPLNTAIYGPVAPDSANKTGAVTSSAVDNDGANSDLSDVLSDLDDDSICSCGEEHCNPEKPSSHRDSSDSAIPIASDFADGPSGASTSDQPSLCRICQKVIEPGNDDNMLRCADCGSTSHPACIDIGGELLQAIRLYRWQCMDCKSCAQCGQPHDEDRMMFCDRCDRGYHTYCVGLSTIPDGHWVCALCAICSACGMRKVSSGVGGNIPDTASWYHELQQILNPSTGQTYTRHQIYCESCHKARQGV